jgi:hypothetical protein
MAFKLRFISVCRLFLFCCAANYTQAQSLQRQSLSCTGGSAAFGNGIIQICVGQPSNTVAVTQGSIRMQQGFLQTLTRIKENDNKIFNIFPNPAIQNVFINGAFTGDETVMITTIHGQILDVSSFLLNDKTMVLNIANLTLGTYNLQIRNHVRIIQSAILIKN